MSRTQKLWVIRGHAGMLVHGVLEINEQVAWGKLKSMLYAVHGIDNSVDTIKRWGRYKTEMLEVPIPESDPQP